MSVGGLYVGGGVAPRILEKLKDGTFMRAFTDKGRLSQLLINMPVRVILESRAAGRIVEHPPDLFRVRKASGCDREAFEHILVVSGPVLPR